MDINLHKRAADSIDDIKFDMREGVRDGDQYIIRWIGEIEELAKEIMGDPVLGGTSILERDSPPTICIPVPWAQESNISTWGPRGCRCWRSDGKWGSNHHQCVLGEHLAVAIQTGTDP